MRTRRNINVDHVVVLFASFCSFLLCAGSLQTLGIFIPPLMEQFDNGSAVLGWISSAGFAIMNLAGPVASVLVNRFDARKASVFGGVILSIGMMSSAFTNSSIQLFVFLGIITGLGASLIFLAIPVNLAQHFTSNYTTAVGLSMAGVSMGVIVLPIVTEELISAYGWRGAILLQGSVTLNLTVFGLLFKPVLSTTKFKLKTDGKNEIDNDIRACEHKCESYETTNSHKSSKDNVKDWKNEYKVLPKSNEKDLGSTQAKKMCLRYSGVLRLLISKPILLTAYTSTFLITVSYVAAFTHMANQASMMGYSSRKSAIVLSSIGVGGAFARACHGSLVDRKILASTTLYELSALLATVGTLINPVLNTYYGYVLSATIIGLTVGIMYPLFYTIMREIVNEEDFSTSTGLALFFDGCGAMAGGYFAGFIRDVTGSYRSGFYLFAACFFAAAIIFIPIIVLQRRKRHNETGTSHIPAFRIAQEI